MGFPEDIKDAADDLFALAGEVVSYISDSATTSVTAIFRGLTAEDLIGPHVMADAVICQIREAELPSAPLRGNTIERSQPLGMQTLEVVDRFRDESGVWRLTCQQNIRVTP